MIDPTKNQVVSNIILPEVQALREASILVQADARNAVVENNAETFIRDIEAEIALAERLRDHSALQVIDLFSFAVFGGALDVVDEALANRPGFLSDSDLKLLAHSKAGYSGGGAIRSRFAGERLMLRNLYQRIYTDDGHGDGRLTPEGFRLLNKQLILRPGNADWLAAPFISAVIAPRREMTDRTNELFDRLESEISKPLWETEYSTIDDDLRRWSESSVDRIRYSPIITEFYRLLISAFAGERMTQRRDATLVALALELYHRRRSEWPKRLDELVPDFLPAVPPDRFTGGPLLYRVSDGQPADLLRRAG